MIDDGSDPAVVRKELAEGAGLLVQTVRADAAGNSYFVEMLLAQTQSAVRSGSLLAKKPEVDLLLRLAGTTQISEAISRIGAIKGKPYLLIVSGTSRRRMKAGGKPLRKRKLTKGDLNRIEEAALLNVRRA